MAMSRFARSRRSRHCSRTMTSPGSRSMSPRRRRPSSRKRPNVRRLARHGCRNSKICRCPRRTKSGRPAAKSRRSIRKRPGCRCLQRLANVGLGRRDEETEPPIAARASGPAMAPMPPLPERKPQRSVAQQIAPVSRYRNMHAGPRRRVWTSTAVRHLLRHRHRATIIWISRPSCAGSPTEVCYNSDDAKGPGVTSRDLCFLPGAGSRRFLPSN